MLRAKKLHSSNQAWSFVPENDLIFYDYKHKVITFSSQNRLQFLPFVPQRFPLANATDLPDMQNSEDPPSDIISFCFSYSLKLMVLHRKPQILEFFDPVDYARNFTLKLAANSSVILYDWIRKSKSGNFFVVTSQGASLLRVDENSISIKKLSSIQTPINNAWFDSKRQVLAINYAGVANRIKIYDLNNVDEGLNFKYPKYIIDLMFFGSDDPESSIPLFQTNAYARQRDKIKARVEDQAIDLVNLYGNSYLMHINSVNGKLYLYRLGAKKPFSINILSDCPLNFNINDNLVILHYLNEKISTTIDVRKDGGMNQIFGAPQSVVADSPVEDSATKDILLQEDSQVEESDPKPEARGNWVEELFYSQGNLNIDLNVIMNIPKRQLMTLEINLEEVLQSSESPVEIFCFLFRRHKSKMLYTSHLKEMLLRRHKLFDVAIILNKILVNYQCALKEISVIRGMMKMAGTKVTLNSYSKLKSGEGFLKLKEIETKLVDPILDIFEGNRQLEEYLLEVLLTFLSLAVEKKVEVGIRLEKVVLSLFVSTDRFQTLYSFVQNGIMNDSFCTAIILCELGIETKRFLHNDLFLKKCITMMKDKLYPPAFQLGIDMLYRIRMNSEFTLKAENLLIENHIRKLKIKEVINLLQFRGFRIDRKNLEELLRNSNIPNADYSFKNVINYFSKAEIETKLIFPHEVFDEIVTNIVKEKEFLEALTED